MIGVVTQHEVGHALQLTRLMDLAISGHPRAQNTSAQGLQTIRFRPLQVTTTRFGLSRESLVARAFIQYQDTPFQARTSSLKSDFAIRM